MLALLVLILPGAALGASAGLRGRLLWGVAPALTLGFTGLAVLVYSRFGIFWSPLSAAVGVALACAVAVAISWPLRARWPGLYPPEPARVGRTAVGVAMAAAAAIAVTVMLIATRNLTRIPQGWDSLFHGAATRLIEQTGDGSPFSLADAAQPANALYYYPDAFHALTALVLHLPGQSMPAALNGMVTATAVVFILAVVALMQRIDPRPLALSAAAVLAASFAAFPLLQAAHGPLSPFALAAAATPGVFAAVFAVLRRPGLPAVLAAGLGMSGIYVTHPAVAATALILIALIGLSWLLWGGRTRTVPALVAVVAAGVCAAAVTLPSVDTGSTGAMSGFDWPATQTTAEAVVNLLGFKTYVAAQWLLTALSVLGLWGLARRRELRPLALGAVVIGWLFVIAASSDAPYVQTLTSLWWNDSWRFLGLYTMVLVPVAAYGVVVLVGLVSRVLGGRAARGRTAVGGVVVLALVAVSAAIYAPRGVDLVERNFTLGGAIYPEEAQAYAQLAAIYDGGAVMNDPFDGSPWLFTLESVPVLLPGPLGPDPVQEMGVDRMDMYSDLHSYGHNPYMEEIVDRLDVRWVVVGEGHLGGKERAPGFVGLAQNPRFEPVISNEKAVVYRILR